MFFEYYFLLPIILNFFLFWHMYFKLSLINKNNFYILNLFIKKKIKNTFLTSFLIKFKLLFFFFFFFFFFNYKTYSSCFFWNNFFILNLNFNLLLFFLIFFLIILSYFYFLEYITFKTNYDYYFILSNLTIFIPLIFFVQNFLIFFFFIEIVAYLFFLNFILTKIWNFNVAKNSQLLIKNNYLKSYINLIFYHFWSTFLSSIIVLFCIIQINNYFLSLDFFIFNFLANNITLSNYIIFFILSLLFLIFIFLKLGLVPMHFFKVEIYNALSFLNILFYSSFYFLFLFIFFCTTILYYFINFSFSFFFILTFLFSVSLFISINFIFDINTLKSFFAFSAISNFLLFLLVLLSTL